MERPTEQDLDDLERLAAAATPRPWRADDAWPRWVVLHDRPGRIFRVICRTPDGTTPENKANAEYIAAAANALPGLVAEVRRLRRQRDALKAAVRRVRQMWIRAGLSGMRDVKADRDRLAGELAEWRDEREALETCQEQLNEANAKIRRLEVQGRRALDEGENVGRRMGECQQQLAAERGRVEHWAQRAAEEAMRHLRHGITYDQEIMTYQKQLAAEKDARQKTEAAAAAMRAALAGLLNHDGHTGDCAANADASGDARCLLGCHDSRAALAPDAGKGWVLLSPETAAEVRKTLEWFLGDRDCDCPVCRRIRGAVAKLEESHGA